MNWNFEASLNLNDYLEAIKSHDEFIHIDRDWYSIIRYAVVANTTFPDPNEVGITPEERRNRILRMDCRGIAFDKQGNCISKPFHKFFNVGEKEYTLPGNIDLSKKHYTMLKLDGSMVRPLFNAEYNGFRNATKSGISDIAMSSEVYVSEHVHYFKFYRYCLEHQLSPCFEWLAPDNVIVIKYSKKELVLTGIRHLYSGEYVSYEEMLELGERFNIPVDTVVDNHTSIDTLLKMTKEEKEIEGYVIRFEDGHMAKMKADLYLTLHGFTDVFMVKRRVYAAILNDLADDMKPNLSEHQLSVLEECEENLIRVISEKVNEVRDLHDKYHNLERKDIAALPLDKMSKSTLFALMDGKNIFDHIKNNLQKYSTRNETFRKILADYKIPLDIK